MCHCPKASSPSSRRSAPTCVPSPRCSASSLSGRRPDRLHTGRPDVPRRRRAAIHDADLAVSWHHDIETVPDADPRRATARRSIARSAGAATAWEAAHRRRPTWAPTCPSMRPGLRLAVGRSRPGRRAAPCGSAARSCRAAGSRSPTLEDEMEALFDRGWTDGLPVVPPHRGARAADARRARPARPTRSSPSCRPTSSSARSRRSRSTR